MEMGQIVNGVGCVCMSAAGLEWSLGYLVHAASAASMKFSYA